MKKAPNRVIPWIIGRSERLIALNRSRPDPGDVEDGLGEDRVAGQQDRDVEPEQGDDRGDRAAQHVLA